MPKKWHIAWLAIYSRALRMQKYMCFSFAFAFRPDYSEVVRCRNALLSSAVRRSTANSIGWILACMYRGHTRTLIYYQMHQIVFCIIVFIPHSIFVAQPCSQGFLSISNNRKIPLAAPRHSVERTMPQHGNHRFPIGFSSVALWSLDAPQGST